jgi:hypothetical protein
MAGDVADFVAAVGEDGDLSVGLHSVAGARFEHAALGFGVIGLHAAEAGGLPVGGHGLADDHLEPAVSAAPLRAGVDIAAVAAHDQRYIRTRQRGPPGGAAVRKLGRSSPSRPPSGARRPGPGGALRGV